jgi:AAA domain
MSANGSNLPAPLWAYREPPSGLDNEWQRNSADSKRHSKPGVDWRAKAESLARDFTSPHAEKLAEILGMPVTVFSVLPLLGHCDSGPHKADDGKSLGPCWTFPEEDGAGNIIGLTCRYVGGEKKALLGGKRGLTVPTGRRERAGPILLPEGPSDTLALSAHGISAIGRPSNTGGLEHLVKILQDVPPERRIIVLGDFDPKLAGDWPGRDGAKQVAGELSLRLGRPVSWAMTPEGAKDTREWCRARKLPTEGEGISDDWCNAGEEFIGALNPRDAPASSDAQATEPGYRCDLIDSATFASGDYKPEWLVKRLLVRNQPGVIGGPRKCLKTSVIVDLAVSLAAGIPFLGKFAVYRPVRVAMLSRESREWTLQETARRICSARGVDFAGLSDRLYWGFRLPQLARPDQLAALRDALIERKIEALLFDPLYLSLLAGQTDLEASNLFQIGPLLLAVGRTCLDVGCTPFLVHHTKKFTSKVLEPLDLDDLAYAGISEFARQWLLIGRAEDYEPGSGEHLLWLSAGGSCGQGGLWQLAVSEGQLADEFTGRIWETKVATASVARSEKATVDVAN